MLTLTAIDFVGKLITGYTGYRKDKLKEDDMLVRKRLESEILKSGEHSRNILELLHDRKDKPGISSLKKVKDELDVFSSEVNLSLVGHRYSFFMAQRARSPTESDLKKLIQFDADMLESLVNVTEALGHIENHIIDSSGIDHAKELVKVRQYITKSRNNYKNRDDFLRGWK